MVSATQLAAAFAGLAAMVSGAALDPRQNNCANGAYVISVHGCGEQGRNEGLLPPYSNGIRDGIRGSRKHILNYNGVCPPGDYDGAVNTGVGLLRGEISNYANRCPNSDIVLVGFSQGAHIIMNTLGGSNYDGSNPLSERLSRRISAVVVMGDPSRTIGAPGNAGNNMDVNGSAARAPASVNNLRRYRGRIISFCDYGDFACAPNTQGPPDVPDVHLSYFEPDHYVNQGVGFGVDVTNA